MVGLEVAVKINNSATNVQQIKWPISVYGSLDTYEVHADESVNNSIGSSNR